MLESKTVTEHVVRGALGFGAVAAALAVPVGQPWLALAAVPLALVALRGCPMCWLFGLIGTLAARRRGACRDGRCPPDLSDRP